MHVHTLFLSHGGVDVYQCYELDWCNKPDCEGHLNLKDFWFATSLTSANFKRFPGNGKKQFNTLSLPLPPLDFRFDESDPKRAIIWAIDEGLLTSEGISRKLNTYTVPVHFSGVEVFSIEARSPAEAEELARIAFNRGEQTYDLGSWQKIERVEKPRLI